MESSCQSDLHLNKLLLKYTLWHLVSRSSNKGKLWSGFIVCCLLCVWGEQSEGRHWGEERACENSVFSVTNISTSRACSINAPLYLISFINTRHRQAQPGSIMKLQELVSHGSCSSIDLTFSLWSQTLCFVLCVLCSDSRCALGLWHWNENSQ